MIQACEQCKKGHRKCDKVGPICGYCSKHKKPCSYIELSVRYAPYPLKQPKEIPVETTTQSHATIAELDVTNIDRILLVLIASIYGSKRKSILKSYITGINVTESPLKSELARLYSTKGSQFSSVLNF
jgi:hypothetical protein